MHHVYNELAEALKCTANSVYTVFTRVVILALLCRHSAEPRNIEAVAVCDATEMVSEAASQTPYIEKFALCKIAAFLRAASADFSAQETTLSAACLAAPCAVLDCTRTGEGAMSGTGKSSSSLPHSTFVDVDLVMNRVAYAPIYVCVYIREGALGKATTALASPQQ